MLCEINIILLEATANSLVQKIFGLENSKIPYFPISVEFKGKLNKPASIGLA